MRGGLSEFEQRRRVRLAKAVASEGGNITIFAERAGLKVCTAFKWLKRSEPDLHRQLNGGPRGPFRTAHQVLVLLLLFKSVQDIPGGQDRLSRALSMSKSRMRAIRARWAPDGLDAAIADMMPDDAEAA